MKNEIICGMITGGKQYYSFHMLCMLRCCFCGTKSLLLHSPLLKWNGACCCCFLFFFSEFHNSEDHMDNSFWIKDLLCHRHRQVDWTEVLFVLYKLNLYLMVLSFWRDLQNSFSLPLSKKIFRSLHVAVENDSLKGLKMEPKEKMKWMMTSCFLFFFLWKTFCFLVLIYEDSFAFFSGRC